MRAVNEENVIGGEPRKHRGVHFLDSLADDGRSGLLQPWNLVGLDTGMLAGGAVSFDRQARDLRGKAGTDFDDLFRFELANKGIPVIRIALSEDRIAG